MLNKVRRDQGARPAQAGQTVHGDDTWSGLGDFEEPLDEVETGRSAVWKAEIVELKATADEAGRGVTGLFIK